MSFRKQLKATFKELLGSGGKETAESKTGGKKDAKSKKGRSATAELVRSPLDAVISPTLSECGSSRGVTYFLPGRSQERVPSYGEANATGYSSVQVDVKESSEVTVAFPVREKLQEKDTPLAPDPVPAKPAQKAWTKALSLLTTQDRLDLFHQSGSDSGSLTDEQAIISTLLNQSIDLQAQAEQRAFIFTNPLNGAKVNLRNKMESFITRINTYVRLGDIAVQHSPQITALVWTGVRLVMTLITQDAETWGILVETMEGIAGVMGRCRIYEKMYASGASEGAGRVQSALVALYASLLVFAVKTKRYFAKAYIKRLYSTGVKPFEIAFGPVIESMRKCEARVEVEARAAAEEAAAGDRGKMMDLLGEMSGVAIPELKVLVSQTNVTVQRIRRAQEEEERLEILQWLSKVKYLDNHKTPAKLREKGTGEWLFDRAEWKAVFGKGEAEALNWWDQPLQKMEGASCVEGVAACSEGGDLGKQEGGLWLYGLPGTGKTILTSLVIDHLNARCTQTAADTTSLLAYFYCSYTEAPRKQAASLLATIVKQLAISLGNRLPAYEDDPSNIGLPKSLTEAYRNHKQHGFSTEHLDLTELENILFKEILPTPGLGSIYIVIDAMDEMEERERKVIFPVLQRLMAFGAKDEAACKVKLFIASRGGQRDLKLALGKDGWKRMGLEKSDTGGDIRKYVESQTAAVIEAGELLDGDVDDGLKEEIVESLVNGAEGMFLWVRYQIANLCEQETEYDVLVALNNLPNGIEETYTTLLERINSQSGPRKRLAYRVLQWMMCATRPMTPRELVEAVAIDPITDKDGIDAKRMVKGVEAIVDICGNFISYDEQLGVLRFVHFTVQEFLEKRLVLASGQNANDTVLQVCLALLCFGRGWRVLGKDRIGSNGDSKASETNGGSEGSNLSEKPEVALAEYAVLNWGHHGRLALEELQRSEHEGGKLAESTPTALEQFLSTSSIYFENWMKAFSALSLAFRIHILDARVDRVQPNQLFICVYFGFPMLFNQSLLKSYPALANPSYSNGWTHFHLAAAIGAHSMIGQLHNLLAVPDITINTRDVDGRTPLHTVASSQRGGRGGAVLSLSLEESLTTKALLQHGCDPMLKDTKSGDFPVHVASEVGNLSVLRALLVYCSTALSLPENMSKVPKFTGGLMLEKQRNVWGYTPLHTVLLAKLLHARAKCEVAMHLLALGGHDVNARDTFMMTPLEKVRKDGLQHEMATLGQFLYDCGGLWDAKKPGLKKVDLKEWGKGGMPVMMFHSPMVAAYRVIAALMPAGRTPAQVQTMVMHQMGGRGRVDKGFQDRCFQWCEQERRNT